MSRPAVVIDLNVRVRGHQTYSGLEDVHGGPIAVGQYVDAVEVESGWRSDAVVTDVDHDKGLVYLRVDWAAGRLLGER